MEPSQENSNEFKFDQARLSILKYSQVCPSNIEKNQVQLSIKCN